MLNRDVITSLTLLAVCIFSWQKIQHISKLGSFFPKVCIAVLAFFSIILLLMSLKKKYDTGLFQGISLKFVKLIALGFTLYIMGVYFIGFFIASFLFLFSFGLILDYERNRKLVFHSALISLGATTFFYVVFKKIFSVPLPPGIFFGG